MRQGWSKEGMPSPPECGVAWRHRKVALEDRLAARELTGIEWAQVVRDLDNLGYDGKQAVCPAHGVPGRGGQGDPGRGGGFAAGAYGVGGLNPRKEGRFCGGTLFIPVL